MDKATGFVRALTECVYATPSENIEAEAWYGWVGANFQFERRTGPFYGICSEMTVLMV